MRPAIFKPIARQLQEKEALLSTMQQGWQVLNLNQKSRDVAQRLCVSHYKQGCMQ